MKLRPYQEDAANAVLVHVRKSFDPCVVEAPTGSGKSWIIAKLAHAIHEMSNKRILVLAPSGELVEQDHEKFGATGESASLYSASVGNKSLRHPVVFGSPLTVANNLEKFKDFAAVILDEAHGITNTVRKIIDHLRGNNPRLRVIGLSATPFRMGTGYIYDYHYLSGKVREDQTRDPYFSVLVYTIDAQLLIDEGFLTHYVIGEIGEHYNTDGLTLNKMGQWNADYIDRAFVGQGRKTASIVADVVGHSRDRKGVMIFAATIQHAKEVLESLPDQLSAIVTGETSKKERESILSRFKKRELKYLVNVSVLTTGFDAPHVDVVAILRSTESAGLFQQIIGRGLRIDPDKSDCLILDYAENIKRHFPDNDLFNPDIKTSRTSGDAEMKVICPACNHSNLFTPKPNPNKFQVDDYGYFTDVFGNRVNTNFGPEPAHFGRQCTGYSIIAGAVSRCKYKWTSKECEECGHENDVSARYCASCKAELVDPNKKLKLEQDRIESDPYATKVSDINRMTITRWQGKDGKPDTLRIDFYIEGGPVHSIPMWLAPESESAWLRAKFNQFCDGVWGERLPDIDAAVDMASDSVTPEKIAYRRKKGSRYYEVISIEYAK